MIFKSGLTTLCVLLSLAFPQKTTAQDYQKVTFPSTDGFSVTADLYHLDKSAPTLILFHQSVSSRGEYRTIAPRLKAMGFNCLAVDLRWGKQDFWNKVPNESAKRNGTYQVVDNYEQTTDYQVNKVWPIIWKAYEDMKASIDYLNEEGYNQEIVVVGSSFSAMLVFKLVSDGLPVDGIAAFSPGEYHPESDSLLASWANDVAVPVYISGGSGEQEMVEEVRSFIPSESRVSLHHSKGRHGASVLMSEEPDWIPLKSFLNQFIQEKPIGYGVLSIDRESDSWDGSGFKALNAWYWYPLNGEQAHVKVDRMQYVSQINPDKTEQENLSSFKRIVNSLAEDSLSDESIMSYLQQEVPNGFDAPFEKNNSPLIVLAGAHPIYFVTLAEKLAQACFNVISVPKAGLKKGERLPFSQEGANEYRKDLNAILDHLGRENLMDTNRIACISWSFEGVPLFEVALERKAKLFLSLDSSLGYEYGLPWISKKTLKELPFDLRHYTGLGMDHGKDLSFLKNITNAQIVNTYDLAHPDFTSLSSISIPEMTNEQPGRYIELVDELITLLKQKQMSN